MKRSNITRKKLTKTVNEKLGFSQRGANDLVKMVFATMKKALISGESVKLVNFGTLTVKKKRPRMGRNPQTNETMEISKRMMVSFKPSKGLRERINSKQNGG